MSVRSTVRVCDKTDQANNQPRPDVAEFVGAVSLVLTEPLEEVFHLKKARYLTCSPSSSLCFVRKDLSKTRTSIVSKYEATHGDEDTHGKRWQGQEFDR